MSLSIFCLSLLLIPIAVPFSLPFLPNIPDLWSTKDFLVLMFATAFIGISNSAGNMGKNENPWLMGLILFIPISIYSSPPLQLIYGFQNMAGLWQYRAYAWILLYFFLSIALGGLPYMRERTQKTIAMAFCWGALISAVYALLQACGLDQWQVARTYQEVGHPASRDIVANIGNPTYLAVYLGICLPFAFLYLPWAVLPIIAVICMAGSDFAFVGSILTAILMICLRYGKMLVLKICAGVLIFGCFLALEQWPQLYKYIDNEGNGRMQCWRETLHDWKSPSIVLPIKEDMTDAQKRDIEILNGRTYVFTGRGPGSFPFIYQAKHKPAQKELAYQVPFDTPHNVYLRVLYELGLVGLVLFVGSILWIFWRAFKVWPFDKFKVAVVCSAFFVAFAMCGIPVEQINPLCYFAVCIFSILTVI